MRRIFALSIKKLSVLFGGRVWLLPICLAALIACFAAVSHAVTAEMRGAVGICVVDECGSELSKRLSGALSEAPGFEAESAQTRKDAEDRIINGSAEAILVILPSYDEGVRSESASGLIDIITAPGSVSAELIRETVAGMLIAQRAREQIVELLVSEGADISRFDEFASEFVPPNIFRIEYVNGAPASRAVFGQGFPGYEGFVALALMLLLLTLSRRLSMPGSRLVSERMTVVNGGRLLSFSSDTLCVLLISLIFAAAAFLLSPSRSLALALGLIAYCLCITGLSLLIPALSGTGRIDMLSPFIALVTSILGGCFADIGSLSPAFAAAAKFTPQGQLIAAVQGKHIFLALLALEGLIMLAFAFVLRRKRADQ